jgi:hypothetical protein
MEHRHFPRKPFPLAVQLLTPNGKTYLARVLDLSAIGMRVVVDKILPERIKLVDVVLPSSDHSTESTSRLRMFVAHKERQVVGLCLVNDRARIDMDSPWLDISAYSAAS